MLIDLLENTSPPTLVDPKMATALNSESQPMKMAFQMSMLPFQVTDLQMVN